MIVLPLGTDKLQMRRWWRKMGSSGMWEVCDGPDQMDFLFSAQAKLLVLVHQVQHLVLMPLVTGQSQLEART